MEKCKLLKNKTLSDEDFRSNRFVLFMATCNDINMLDVEHLRHSVGIKDGHIS